MGKSNSYESLKKAVGILALIVGAILIVLYINRWNEVKDFEKYRNSYLIDSNTISLEMKDIDEIDTILDVTETPNFYFLYISYTNDEDIYNLEKQLKPLIDDYHLQDKFYYLNVTTIKEENPDYKDEIANNLHFDVDLLDKLPVILYFENGELAYNKAIYNAQDFQDLLETEDIKTK